MTFSGASTTDPGALQRSLGGAVRAEITRGGFLVYAVDPADDVLHDETLKYVDVVGSEVIASIDRPQHLAELRDALAVDEVTDFICMCTGDLAIEFFDSRNALIAVVRVDLPSGIEWPLWAGRANLVDPRRFGAWLARHSIVGGRD